VKEACVMLAVLAAAAIVIGVFVGAVLSEIVEGVF
jgi:hypothetical protein